jgi:hypothetical protein
MKSPYLLLNSGLSHACQKHFILSPMGKDRSAVMPSRNCKDSISRWWGISTNKKGLDDYLARRRKTGDFHGQAATIWAADALGR